MSGNEKRGKTVQGFVRGLLWGTVAAAGGLAVVSQVAGPVRQVADPAPLAEEAAVPVAEEAAAPPVVAPVEPESAPEAQAPQAPSVAEAVTPETDAAPTAASEAPEPAPAPEPVAPAPVVPGQSDVAEVPSAVDAPVAPAADEAAQASPLPVEPPVAPPTEPPGAESASAGQINPPVLPPQAEPPAAAGAPAVPGQPEAEGGPSTAELPPPPPLTPEEEALLRPLPEPEPAPQPEPQIIDPTPEPTAPAEPPAQAGVVAGEGTLAPAPGLGDAASGVVTGRLPRIGAEEAPAAAAPEAADAVAEADLPPLRRYARPFEREDQKPLFAILLEDTGAEDVNRAELAALDLPLSIVIDPLAEGAAALAAEWRAGGQEVVMAGTGIPQGAGPGDLEQSFQVLSSRLPEAVAVIDPTGTAFQNDRPLATQVVPILIEQGRGLVTFDQGLNAADQVARREGLASAMVFRRLDAEGEDSPVIRRYLDRAAFKAAQEGRVIVLGEVRPQTIAAILEWAVEGRASTVTLAPVSAMLQGD